MAGEIEKRPEWARLPAREVSVSAGYELWAPSYDDERNFLFPLEEAAVDRWLGALAPRTVLDAATGTGRHLARLRRSGARVVGLDQSAGMLARAAATRPAGAELTRGSFDRLPFIAGCFDLVVCALALCHVPDLGRPLAEFRRVLGPQGHVLITDFHPDAAAWGLRSEFRRDGVFVRLPNPQRDFAAYLRAIEDAGFQVRSVEEFTQGDVGLPLSRDLAPEFRDEWPRLNFGLVVFADAV